MKIQLHRIWYLASTVCLLSITIEDPLKSRGKRYLMTVWLMTGLASQLEDEADYGQSALL